MTNIPRINLEKTGINIIKLRQEAGLTVKDLQTELGLGSAQAIYRWQNGETLPTVDNLVLLAKILDVTIDNIIICDKVY